MGSHASSRLVLRADANATIGIGHVMRCLALAEAWHASGGQAHFVCCPLPADLRQRMADRHIEVHASAGPAGSSEDARAVVELASQLDAAWIAADGYAFQQAFQQSIRDAGRRLLLIDDYGHADAYVANLVLNQNMGADESMYPHRGADTELLLGERYVMLRREFSNLDRPRREIPASARRILVTMGGADPANISAGAVHAIRMLPGHDTQAIVVAGASSPHHASLRELVDDSGESIRLVSEVKNMPELMCWADVAISAGGTTTWERAFLGLPSLIVVLAENQRQIAEAVAARGLAINLGDFRTVTPKRMAAELATLIANRGLRQQMAELGPQCIDGRGADRVISLLQANRKPADAHLLSR